MPRASQGGAKHLLLAICVAVLELILNVFSVRSAEREQQLQSEFIETLGGRHPTLTPEVGHFGSFGV